MGNGVITCCQLLEVPLPRSNSALSSGCAVETAGGLRGLAVSKETPGLKAAQRSTSCGFVFLRLIVADRFATHYYASTRRWLSHQKQG
jgi:hypothetical protein